MSRAAAREMASLRKRDVERKPLTVPEIFSLLVKLICGVVDTAEEILEKNKYYCQHNARLAAPALCTIMRRGGADRLV